MFFRSKNTVKQNPESESILRQVVGGAANLSFEFANCLVSFARKNPMVVMTLISSALVGTVAARCDGCDHGGDDNCQSNYQSY